MSFQKFKSDSYCVGGRHRSATVKIYGDITSKGSKVNNYIGADYTSLISSTSFRFASLDRLDLD